MNTQNEFGTGYAEHQRLANANKYQSIKNWSYGILAAAAIATGAAFVTREVYNDYKNLEAEAQTAITTGDRDMARKVVEASDSTDMGCLYGGLYKQLKRTAKQD